MGNQVKTTCLALVAILLMALPCAAYYFQGYYVPAVLVSPMKDNMVYTPVGMGVVTSKAGFRVHPVTGKGDFHSGVDLGARLNDKVYCLMPGVVTRVGWRGNLGVAVEVYCPYPNIRVICGHLNAYAVQPGMWVQRGRVIGYAGSTGRSTGVHVHYTVIKNDTKQYIEPMAYLLQVPGYMSALKTGYVRGLAMRNAEAFRKAPPKAEPTHSESVDLPDKTPESAPPETETPTSAVPDSPVEN
jgi:murein DD-endopeptidase MepM/ murein hydrolase activator NlpD